MKNIKIHFIYISLIVLLSIALLITNIPNVLRLYFYRDGITYMKINQDFEMINPMTGEAIGKVYKGAVLQGPLIEDLDDTDLGDNDRWKILLDADIVKKENREYIKKGNQSTIPFSYGLSDTEQHLQGHAAISPDRSIEVRDKLF